MRVKSYYAGSVEAAMNQAGAELGPDAVLMHSRKTPAELRHLGPYEVVFALPRAAGRPGPAAPEHPAAAPGDTQVSLELMQMRRQIEEIRRSLATRGEVRSNPVTDSAAATLWKHLTEAAVDDELAREIADQAALRAAERGAAMDDECARGYFLWPEMERRLTPPPAPLADTAPVYAFIGPPGCGKTSCMMKLAVTLQSSYASDVALISADNLRIGAADQLRSYGAILGAAVDAAENGPALQRLIELRRRKGPVLIDTPGLGSADFQLMSDLPPVLAAAGGVCRMLVLPATMRARDLRRLLRDYDVFHPDRLAFTRLDETDLFGPLFSAAVWSGLPAAYLSAGQQIPDDLEPASPARIVELVLGPPVAPETNLVN